MKIAATHRTRLGTQPTPLRILAYLMLRGEPVHFATIARDLHQKPSTILDRCARMAKDGRLKWITNGTYTLNQE